MELNMLFSERLKETRKVRGFTQDRLSELTGIHKKVISKYEQGAVLPGTDNLQKLVVALKVSADFLLLPEASMTGLPEINDLPLFRTYAELDNLPQKEREAALLVIQSLVSQHKLKQLAKECPD